MARKKTAAAGGETPPDRHKVITIRIDGPLRDAIESQAGRERRSLANMLQVLAEEALVARGLLKGEPPAS